MNSVNIEITKKLNNKNITFKYGMFIQTLGLQLKNQTNNRYILKNSSYLSEIAENCFKLFDEGLISEDELNRIINDFDIKIRKNIEENPARMKYKYKTLSEILPKRNTKKKEELKQKIFDEVENLYFNENIKQIEIARKLLLDPKSVNYIILKLERKKGKKK